MDNLRNEERRSSGLKIFGITALIIAAVGIFSIMGYNYYSNNYSADSIVELDANPSIKIKVNRAGSIIEATPLNDEGSAVLRDITLKNTNIHGGVKTAIESMCAKGFLSKSSNSILVSVQNKDAERGKHLSEKISREIKEMLQAKSIPVSILSQLYVENNEVKALEQQHHVSGGMAKLINEISNAHIKDLRGQEISSAALAKMSVNDINLLLDSKDSYTTNIKKTGANASDNAYIGKEKAKKIALNHANVDEKNTQKVDVSLDFDSGFLVYEVDFQVGNSEYSYEINAKSGQIIETDNDIDDDYLPVARQRANIARKKHHKKIISRAKAKKIAFSHAKVHKRNVRRLKVDLERDDGIRKYEVDFKVGRMEYDYEIHAKTGAIIKYDKEYDD